MGQNQASQLDEHGQAIREWVKDGSTNDQIVQLLLATFQVSTSEAAIRRAKKRWGIKSPERAQKGPGEADPSFETDGDTAAADSGKSGRRLTEEDLRRTHKLSEEEWESTKTVASEWGDPLDPNYQIKVWFKRRKVVDLIVPARIPGDYIAPKPRRKMASEIPQLWIVAGDEQAIFHHRELDELVNEFIAQEQPHGYVGTGDLTDQNAVSRHKRNAHDRWNSPLQQDVNHGGRILRGRRIACEDMLMWWMPGNHDIRTDAAIQQFVMEAYGLTPAQWDDMDDQKAGLSLPTLLRLDELNIEYVDPMGEYEHAQFKIGPHVAVRHGSRTGKNAALQTIDRLTHSVIMGHTHAQSIQHRTIYDIDRNHRIITAVETGALCDFTQVMNGDRLEKGQGLGYAIDPNWVNGFTTVTLWPDGSHHIENATFDGNALYWRGKRYA